MLLLHDLEYKDFNKILGWFPRSIEVFSKDLDNIQSCLGCFNCWLKTPGVCAIKDDYTKFPKAIVNSNTFIIISKIHYGCYSPYIKNVLDRSIPYILPFFQLVNGEVHHQPRYNNKPKFMVIGYGEDITKDEEATFKDLVKANIVNLHFKDYEVHMVRDISAMKPILENLGGA